MAIGSIQPVGYSTPLAATRGIGAVGQTRPADKSSRAEAVAAPRYDTADRVDVSPEAREALSRQRAGSATVGNNGPKNAGASRAYGLDRDALMRALAGRAARANGNENDQNAAAAPTGTQAATMA